MLVLFADGVSCCKEQGSVVHMQSLTLASFEARSLKLASLLQAILKRVTQY